MPKSKLATAELEQVSVGTQAPDFNTTQYGGQNQTSGRYFPTRICPYCDTSIPASEDPCHICGHLEPAELPGEKNPLGEKSTNGVNGYAILMLWLGLTMIVWPEAVQTEPRLCDPDTIISCFMDNAWGVSGGVFLVTISILSIAWTAISNRQLVHKHKE